MVSIIVSVLLVEDNAADERMAQEIIDATKLDVSLTIARDGIQALSAIKEICAKKSSPTILLLDLNFPYGDGFQVLEFIRRFQCCDKIRKIVLTGSSRLEDKIRAEELGADEYFFKPMCADDLVSLVESLRSIFRR